MTACLAHGTTDGNLMGLAGNLALAHMLPITKTINYLHGHCFFGNDALSAQFHNCIMPLMWQ